RWWCWAPRCAARSRCGPGRGREQEQFRGLRDGVDRGDRQVQGLAVGGGGDRRAAGGGVDAADDGRRGDVGDEDRGGESLAVVGGGDDLDPLGGIGQFCVVRDGGQAARAGGHHRSGTAVGVAAGVG